MFEKSLVSICAPTLAGLKAASLFSYKTGEGSGVNDELREYNALLNKKGIHLAAVGGGNRRELIYVYRKDRLARILEDENNRAFLSSYGYSGFDIGNCVSHLSKRVEYSEAFPHEIGLFLGYPLADVKGFIENGGKNCICSGCWKVYESEEEALKTFWKYTKCRDIYLKQYLSGKPVSRLAVS